MSRPIDESPPELGRVLELTPSGRRAVDAPQLGLTISQRWLLMRIGEGASLADIGASAGAPAQVVRLPRDAARLVGLGLAVDVGEPGPALFSNTTRSGDLTGPAPLADASVQTSPSASRDLVPDTAAARPARPRTTALGLIAIGLVGAGAAYWAVRPARAPAMPLPVAVVPAKPRTGATADVVVRAPAESVVDSAPVARDAAQAPAAVVASVGLAASSPIDASRAPTALEPPAPSPSKLAAAPAPLPVLRLQSTPAPATGVALSERLAAGPTPTLPPAAIRPQPTVSAAPPLVPPPQVPAPAPAPSVPEIVATAPIATETSVARAAALPLLAPLSRSTPTFPRDVGDDTRREVSLQAQLVIGANGEVTRVEFPGSWLRNRPYERVARSALLQWRFPAGAADRSYRTELNFKAE